MKGKEMKHSLMAGLSAAFAAALAVSASAQIVPVAPAPGETFQTLTDAQLAAGLDVMGRLDPAEEKAFIDELRTKNGNLEISIIPYVGEDKSL